MDWKDRLTQMPPMAAAGGDPGQPRQWYRIQAKVDTADEVDVYVYGVIGGWWAGVDASQFVRELRDIDAKQINVHINSVGGSVFDGNAIFQSLRNHKARIVTYVDALAASAASVVAMAGDRRVIAPYAQVMVHKAWGLCIGNDDDMEKSRDELARFSKTLASVYANRAGGEVAEWLDVMTAETWYDAQEAVDAGLMHEVQEDAEKTADDDTSDAANSWGMQVFAQVFNYTGREQAPPPRIPRPAAAVTTPSAAEPAAPEDVPAAEPDPSTTEEDPVSTLNADVRQRLGLADDADDTAILAALDALKTQAETPPTPDPELVAASAAATAERDELRKEVDLLATQVQDMSAKLAATEAEKAATVKASAMDAAVKDGKIAPAQREQWEADYDEAPAAVARVLASIAPGTAVPVMASGHTGPAEPDAGSDAEWDRLKAELWPADTASKGA